MSSAASDDGEDPLALPDEDDEVLLVRQNVHRLLVRFLAAEVLYCYALDFRGAVLFIRGMQWLGLAMSSRPMNSKSTAYFHSAFMFLILALLHLSGGGPSPLFLNFLDEVRVAPTTSLLFLDVLILLTQLIIVENSHRTLHLIIPEDELPV